MQADISDSTVDGRDPVPVDRQFIPLFSRFHTSQVVNDFFHQQYLTRFVSWNQLGFPQQSQLEFPTMKLSSNRLQQQLHSSQ